jgi:alpha-ketoglutarate-dependent taurine dioxygenase
MALARPRTSVIERDLGGCAWTRDGLSAADWTVPVPDACLAEIAVVVGRLRDECPGSIETMTPDRFALSSCAGLMNAVREKLVGGPGIAVLDRFPVQEYTADEAKAVGWLLAGILGRIVAQKWDGTRLYDVKDSGQALGYGVRRSVTNLEQPFHTDGPWLWQPPAFVGLFCVATARAGGESRVTSLVSAHNALRARARPLLERLYAPFHWDRQAEHGPDEARWATHPVFASDGATLSARYYDDYITNGQRLAGEPLDAEGIDALAALRDIVDASDHRVEFRIEQGQLQYLNNRQVAHSRTAFRDSPEPGQIRHMLRLWNREEGTLHVDGQLPA